MILFVFVVALLFLPVSASSVEIPFNGIYYNLTASTKQAEVTSKPSGTYSGSISIPQKVTYKNETYNVTTIRLFPIPSRLLRVMHSPIAET